MYKVNQGAKPSTIAKEIKRYKEVILSHAISDNQTLKNENTLLKMKIKELEKLKEHFDKYDN